jgi:hypothetical protein
VKYHHRKRGPFVLALSCSLDCWTPHSCNWRKTKIAGANQVLNECDRISIHVTTRVAGNDDRLRHSRKEKAVTTHRAEEMKGNSTPSSGGRVTQPTSTNHLLAHSFKNTESDRQPNQSNKAATSSKKSPQPLNTQSLSSSTYPPDSHSAF